MVRETKDFIASLVTHLYEQCSLMFVLPDRDVSEIKLDKNGHLTTKKYHWNRSQELQAIIVESVEYSSVKESKLL